MARFPRMEQDGLAPWRSSTPETPVPHKLTVAEVVELRQFAHEHPRLSWAAIGARFGVIGQTAARLARGHLRRKAGGPIEGKDYPFHKRPSAVERG